MQSGILFYNPETDRMDILFGNGKTYGGLHCGTCFDVKIRGRYTPTRIEKGCDWFLVDTGLKGADALAGLKSGCRSCIWHRICRAGRGWRQNHT